MNLTILSTKFMTKGKDGRLRDKLWLARLILVAQNWILLYRSESLEVATFFWRAAFTPLQLPHTLAVSD